MKIFTITLLFFISCSLLKKEENKNDDILSILFLSIAAQTAAAGCGGPKSGFTICIPKAIAE
ncbi:hypothetical protein P3G55_12150 [Leptospira sp. 96542]|nr:hypothetical protein [Leptospira sp. 96542]